MYTAADIKSSDDEPGQRYYFLDGADLSNQDKGIAEKWKIVDYVNSFEDIDTYFSATTYKNGENVVIAYRGTNEPIGEWVNNFVGVGILNYHSEEAAAKRYALKIADRYPESKIYITGHSLGGYLAQIGAAEMINEREVNLAKIAYFNGIGLKYNKLLFWTKCEALDTLRKYAQSNSLISFETKGDVVSAIGIHSGEEKTYLACMDVRKNHSGKHDSIILTKDISFKLESVICVMTLDDLMKYYLFYNCNSIAEYFWVTHETDNFYYWLIQGRRGPNEK